MERRLSHSRACRGHGAAASDGGQHAWKDRVSGRDKPAQNGEGLVLSRTGAVELGTACPASDHHASLQLRPTASQECYERLGRGDLVRRFPLGGVAVMRAAGMMLSCATALAQMCGLQASGNELLCPLYATSQDNRDGKQIALGCCADPVVLTAKPYWCESSRNSRNSSDSSQSQPSRTGVA